MELDAKILYESALEECAKLQQQVIEYKALYMATNRELSIYKQKIEEEC